jgi:hypothetical protein
MKTYSSQHADIANWLRTQVSDGCCRVHLTQRVGVENQHVREWPIAEGVDVDALAEEIDRRMREEARVLRGPTRYTIFGFKLGAYDYHDRKIVLIEGIGASTDMVLGETEQPDGRGIVSQMMRHNEASARISLGQTMAIVEHYKAILHERDARIAVLEQKLEQLGELQQEIVSMQHERNLDIIREKRADRRHAFLREKLDMLTPAIMSKVLGAGTAKGQGSMFGEELLRQFLKSLGAKQYAAITNALTPEQVVALTEIFERYSERETQRERAAAAAEANDNGTGSPEDTTGPGGPEGNVTAAQSTGTDPVEEKK